jgi:hypothetical protein
MKSCFTCGHAFGGNTDLEWLPSATMVAFDSRRGRLWLICRWCAHWSLVPIEERWEAVEELERRAPRAPVLASTDAIALLQVGGVRALRVGRAPAREEAWWRYGPSLRGRSRRYAYVTRAGGAVATTAAVGTLVLLAFVPGMVEIAVFGRVKLGRATTAAGRVGADWAADFDRRFRYGRIAWQGSAPCGACGGVMSTLGYRDLGTAVLSNDGTVRVPCGRCGGSGAGHRIPPGEARDLLRRSLSYTNIAGASMADLDAAVELIRAGAVGTAPYAGPLSFRDVPRPQAIALELAATERTEAVLLGLELRELEERWRSAEAIAAIVDRELT